MTIKRSPKVLIGIDEICKYMGISGRKQFKSFLEYKMPVGVQSGRYYAHTENLERWFEEMTGKSLQRYEEEIE
ncbi:MAG: hypothetical protein KAT70_02300 [Thermoplasmata archaeon]|nr:hypothetical protein [Thermoplasmata archaeon]